VKIKVGGFDWALSKKRGTSFRKVKGRPTVGSRFFARSSSYRIFCSVKGLPLCIKGKREGRGEV